MILKILPLMMVLTAGQAIAHEGHDHDAPTTLQPAKGGIVKAYPVESKDGKKDQNCFVEVAKSKNDLKIYFFDSAQKLSDAKDFELTASARPFSRSGKSEAVVLKLEDKKTFYFTSYDKKNAHKFDLVLKFKGPDFCKANEEITFLID